MSELPPDALIVRPQPANIRDVWPYEDRNFTPWLAANLDWLEEAVNLGGLELVEVEARLPGYHRYLDIVARAADGTLVAIENQYRSIDHDHLTRGIAYALGHDCGALVIVAEGHGGEFVRIADYLNEAYEALGPGKGIAAFLVTVKVQKVGQHFVPRFECVARPNDWLVAVHQEASPSRSASLTVETFLAQCTDEFRPVAEQILAGWSRRPGASMRLNPKSASVSLDRPYGDGGHSSVFVIYSDTLGINRGYYLESGAVKDREEELDSVLSECFPGITPAPYYPSTKTPDPTGVARFTDWLTQQS